MILPFYDKIEKQAYRIYADNDMIFSQIPYYCRSNELPTFQYIFPVFFDNYKIVINYINSNNQILGTIDVPDGYIELLDVNGKKVLSCKGGALGFEHPECKYFIQIFEPNSTDIHNDYFSEVITVQNVVKPNGRLEYVFEQGFLQLNKGGYLLLNSAEYGIELQPLTEIKLRASKNFSDYNLNGFEMRFLTDADIHLESQSEYEVSKEYSGKNKCFKKTIQSVYSIQFFTTKQVANNIDRLQFFDEILIYDKLRTAYEVTERLDTSHERIEGKDIYSVEITFKTQYDIDFTNIIQEESEVNMMEALIGSFFSVPADKTIEQTLAAKNTGLEGTGYKWIACEGQNLDPSAHPKWAAIMGVKNIGGSDRIVIPDARGKVLIGAGTHTDKNNTTKTFSSGADAADGEYSHKLNHDEMTHYHAIGTMEWLGGTADARGCIFHKKLNKTNLDTLNFTEFDGDEPQISGDLAYGGSARQYNRPPEYFRNDTSDFIITTKNDNTESIKEGHVGVNLIQPALGAYVITVIDDVSF